MLACENFEASHVWLNRMLKMAAQQGRGEVRDAKNNERHVFGRARVGERPVYWPRRSPSHPPTPSCQDSLFSEWGTLRV